MVATREHHSGPPVYYREFAASDAVVYNARQG